MIDNLKNWTGNFLISSHGSVSYQDLTAFIDSAHLKFEYIQEGETIIIYGNYSLNTIGLLLAFSSKNIKIAPIVPTTEAELEKRITALRPNRIFHCTTDEIVVEDLSYEIDSTAHLDGSKLVIFSSGTTGIPKIMEHKFESLLTRYTPAKRQKNLTFIVTLLFDHIGGLNTLFNCLNQGVQLVVPKDNSPETVVEAIGRHAVNVLPTSPTFLNILLQSELLKNEKLASLKLITYGTEKMPILLLERLHKAFPG